VRHLAETGYGAVLISRADDTEKARLALHRAAEGITDDVVTTQAEIIGSRTARR